MKSRLGLDLYLRHILSLSVVERVALSLSKGIRNHQLRTYGTLVLSIVVFLPTFFPYWAITFLIKILCFSFNSITKAQACRKCEPAVAVNVGNVANLQRGLSFCCLAATTFIRFAWFPEESAEAYFRLDFCATF